VKAFIASNSKKGWIKKKEINGGGRGGLRKKLLCISMSLLLLFSLSFSDLL
jgi:hypothetical protein